MAAVTGILHVYAKGARALRDVEVLGLKQDPFLRLKVGGHVFVTKTDTDAGRNAVWNEQFTAHLRSNLEREFLYLTVMDKNDLVNDKEIGCAKLPLVDVPAENYDGTFDLYDEHARKCGMVDISLRLERFPPAMMTPYSPVPSFHTNNQQQQYQQQQHVAYPSTPERHHPQQPMVCVMPAPHLPPMHSGPSYPASPAPTSVSSSLGGTGPYYQAQQVVVPGALAYASTPARPFTPVPPASLLSCSPYVGSTTGLTGPTSASFSSPSYKPPQTPSSSIGMEEKLPLGWEERQMPDGRVFYIDHMRKITTWERPLPNLS